MLIFNTSRVGYWLFITIFVYLGVRLACSILGALRRRAEKTAFGNGFALKLTARFMGLFFVSGTLIFAFTFPVIGKVSQMTFNNTEIIVRSLICSLDMFMLDIDSNRLDRLGEHPMLKAAIAVQAVCSFACTLAILASLVFSRAKAYYNLNHRTRITPDRNHLYLFFGINGNSRMLASDIHRHDSRAITIFIDEADVIENDRGGWDSIVGILTHKRSALECADRSGALVSVASGSLRDAGAYMTDDRLSDLLSSIGLGKIKNLINDLRRYPEGSRLSIFFLSDNGNDNIRDILALARDTTVLEAAMTAKADMKIYCHARYTDLNRMVRDSAVRENIDIEIVDSSHLAVELLKSKGENHPVRAAHLSGTYPTIVERPLEALVVGFGEVGRDAFRFIYEFGTFVRHDGLHPTIAKPLITAIDSKMNQIEGSFRTKTPAIIFSQSTCGLKNLGCDDAEFYRDCLSEDKCRSINYIVVALGNDNVNISAATRIFDRIRRYRADMSHLIIMVHCAKEENAELMQKIADHNNKGCGNADINVIRIFGVPSEIYSFDAVICGKLLCMGKFFHQNYLRLTGCCRGSDEWTRRREEIIGTGVHNHGKESYPLIDNLRRLRRQESQNLSNALHAETKIWLIRQALESAPGWSTFTSRLFHISGKSTVAGAFDHIYYPYLTAKENDTMRNLAILEHCRWVASHELLGYTLNKDSPRCDERTLRHNCLIDWDKLDSESRKASTKDRTRDYKSQDYSVVETSIALFYHTRPTHF